MASLGKDLWEEALKSLGDEERKALDPVGKDSVGVLEDLLKVVERRKTEAMFKRWKIAIRGKTIVIRDVFDKISAWIGKLLQIGDAVVSSDPGHAALPWAAVRLIVQAAIDDNRTFTSVLQRVEKMANSIARCRVVERLYSSSKLDISDQLQSALIKHHASILKYLAEVLRYFGTNTAIRFVKSSFILNSRLEDLSSQIDQDDAEVCRLSTIAESERNERTAEALAMLHDEAAAKAAEEEQRVSHLRDILADLEQPIQRIETKVSQLHENLEREVRAKILRSISTISYPTHHKAASRDRLRDSGSWLLQDSSYNDWRAKNISAVLWLHGLPGSGKTKLASLVFDTIKEEEQVAAFYCARTPQEPGRAQCDKILASFVRQLACMPKNQNILEPVLDRYREQLQEFGEFEDQSWTTEESVEILIDLLGYYPSVTIVLDALDEVERLERPQLLDAITDLAGSSVSLVKVLITSREQYDIALRLRHLPNVYISTDDNRADIYAFIDNRLERARLLNGQISEELKVEVTKSLQERAQGMFRLVEMQIQVLRSLRTAADIESRLNVLPETLKESYRELYEDIKQCGDHALFLANMVFQYLLVAEENIQLSDIALLAPFWPSSRGTKYTLPEIRDVCAILVSVDDEDETLRFSHLSVREYFEDQAKQGNQTFHSEIANAAVASAYLSFVSEFLWQDKALWTSQLVRRDDEAPVGRLAYFAVRQWKTYYLKVGSLRSHELLWEQLRSFTIQDGHVSAKYRFWTLLCSLLSPAVAELDNTINPLWLACEKNSLDLLEHILQYEFFYVSHTMSSGDTPLSYAISKKNLDQLQLILSYRPQRYLMELPTETFNDILEVIEKNEDPEADRDSPFLRVADPTIGLTVEEESNTESSILAKGIIDSNSHALKVLLSWSKPPDVVAAVSRNRVRVVQYALATGKAANTTAMKALRLAVSNGNEEMVKMIEQYGVEKERVAVVRALKQQAYGTAIRLIEAGYDVHGRYLDKWRTPLHYAAANGRPDIVAMLLERGARADILDGDGFTPLQLARRAKYDGIAEMFLRHRQGLPLLAPSVSVPDLQPTELKACAEAYIQDNDHILGETKENILNKETNLDTEAAKSGMQKEQQKQGSNEPTDVLEEHPAKKGSTEDGVPLQSDGDLSTAIDKLTSNKANATDPSEMSKETVFDIPKIVVIPPVD